MTAIENLVQSFSALDRRSKTYFSALTKVTTIAYELRRTINQAFARLVKARAALGLLAALRTHLRAFAMGRVRPPISVPRRTTLRRRKVLQSTPREEESATTTPPSLFTSVLGGHEEILQVSDTFDRLLGDLGATVSEGQTTTRTPQIFPSQIVRKVTQSSTNLQRSVGQLLGPRPSITARSSVIPTVIPTVTTTEEPSTTTIPTSPKEGLGLVEPSSGVISEQPPNLPVQGTPESPRPTTPEFFTTGALWSSLAILDQLKAIIAESVSGSSEIFSSRFNETVVQPLVNLQKAVEQRIVPRSISYPSGRSRYGFATSSALKEEYGKRPGEISQVIGGQLRGVTRTGKKLREYVKHTKKIRQRLGVAIPPISRETSVYEIPQYLSPSSRTRSISASIQKKDFSRLDVTPPPSRGLDIPTTSILAESVAAMAQTFSSHYATAVLQPSISLQEMVMSYVTPTSPIVYPPARIDTSIRTPLSGVYVSTEPPSSTEPVSTQPTSSILTEHVETVSKLEKAEKEPQVQPHVISRDVTAPTAPSTPLTPSIPSTPSTSVARETISSYVFPTILTSGLASLPFIATSPLTRWLTGGLQRKQLSVLPSTISSLGSALQSPPAMLVSAAPTVPLSTLMNAPFMSSVAETLRALSIATTAVAPVLIPPITSQETIAAPVHAIPGPGVVPPQQVMEHAVVGAEPREITAPQVDTVVPLTQGISRVMSPRYRTTVTRRFPGSDIIKSQAGTLYQPLLGSLATRVPSEVKSRVLSVTEPKAIGMARIIPPLRTTVDYRKSDSSFPTIPSSRVSQIHPKMLQEPKIVEGTEMSRSRLEHATAREFVDGVRKTHEVPTIEPTPEDKEKDLRELRKKMERILAEEARRYFGTDAL